CFEEALNIADASPGGGYNASAVLEDYGVWALALGDTDLAKTCFTRAVSMAQQQQVSWAHALYSLRMVDFFARLGNVELAYEFLKNVVESHSPVTRVKVMCVAIGIPIALQMQDTKLLETFGKSAALELAFQSGEDFLIGRTAASLSKYFIVQG